MMDDVDVNYDCKQARQSSLSGLKVVESFVCGASKTCAKNSTDNYWLFLQQLSLDFFYILPYISVGSLNINKSNDVELNSTNTR